VESHAAAVKQAVTTPQFWDGWSGGPLGVKLVYGIDLVGAIGFEPTTPCAQGRCATRLRYAPTATIIDDQRESSRRFDFMPRVLVEL
jgi:hypothetical protein